MLNIGNHAPAALLDYLEALEHALGRKARRNLMPMQPGDVKATFAETALLTEWTDFSPGTRVRQGVKRFADWYRDYYKV